MRGTYRCTNVKFCMEDENQYRAWEYLHRLNRRNGSYGKILSDALIMVLDNQINKESMMLKNGDITYEMQLFLNEAVRKATEETSKLILKEIREALNEIISLQGTKQFSQEKNVVEQGQEDTIAEDMLDFAFAMSE